jgi:hypothetical protein
LSDSRPPRPRIRIDEKPVAPSAASAREWHQSPEGVLRRAIEESEKQPYTELVIVALRGGSEPEVFTFARDRLRIVGLLTWTLDTLLARLRD